MGLGRAEMYAAMLAVKKLGEDTTRNVATVRFFGKFFGLYADYYVFETTLKDAPEIPEAAGEQGQGWEGRQGRTRLRSPRLQVRRAGGREAACEQVRKGRGGRG